jgi:hypothetical protein
LVVENKTGAGGIIGTVSVTKSPPDGYTLLIASTTIATSTASGKKPPYGKSTNNLERSRSSGARQAEGLLEMSGHGAADRRKSNMRVAPGSGVYAATAEVPQRDRETFGERVMALTAASAGREINRQSGTEVDMTPPGQSAAMIAVADVRAPT